MCGIVGTLVFRDHPFTVTETYITNMRDTMFHRGPDGGKTWIADDGRVGLGHRRLAILDLTEAAAQPMCNEDGTLWLAFNGEIYNHTELRQELLELGGHQWKTDHSDSEVILHAFEQWGIDCIHKFRGMFSIALWDIRNRELWLIRDRIGIKPLYYSIHDGRIVFASEIKALLKDPDQKRAVNEDSFYHYLSFLTTPAPQTLFDGINKLAGGTWLCIDDSGHVKEKRYWDVLDHIDSLEGCSEEVIAQRLRKELRESVNYRKVSDVPMGVFLSGGVDSSANTALFSEGEENPVKTFSIGYDRSYASYENELIYARQMADYVGAEYHEKLLSINDLLEFLPDMIHLQDEPISDPVCVPVYYVSRLAREHGVTVCQVGEGADELFCGYPGWKIFMNLQHLNNIPFPAILKIAGLKVLSWLGKDQKMYFEWLRRGAAGQPIFWGGAEAFSEIQKQQLLSPRLRHKYNGMTSWEAIMPIWERFQDKAGNKSTLNWMSYLDLNLRLPELLLMRVDKMSMGVSLECRVPFLDHKFVELAMGIPEKLKIKNGILKYILKSSVHGLIPDDLIHRKKQGFGVPVSEWFVGQLGDRARKELCEFCDETDFFNKSEVMRLIEKGDASAVWYILNFALWWKAYINDTPSDHPKIEE